MSDTSYSDSKGGGGGGSNLLGLGALGIGALGFGSILGQGEKALPWQFGQLSSNAGTEFGQGQTLFGEGQTLYGQGAEALQMAQNGQLTAPQQAELNQFAQGEKNTAAQTYASMGRNINQDTSGISTQQNIDASINAMAQKEIATTIQLGLGELSAGGSMTGQALGFENAANTALIQAGQAQLQNDKDYSTALTGAFSSIATILGSVGKLAMV